jgi:glucose dehydrogenase
MARASDGARVCIVGAGAAGAVMAAELARQGIGVLVLESGPWHDVGQRPAYARRVARRENPWRTANAALDLYTNGGSVPYRLDLNRARGVGGSTLHWEGYTLRFRPDDFRLATHHGLGEDWPVGYEELEPYYVRAEAALGVAGLPDDPWAGPRSAGYPLPPFPFSYSDQIFAGACREVGVSFQRLPQARNSLPYGGRAQCRACATCMACPIGAKASVDLTHLTPRPARVTVMPGTVVRRLEVGRSGRVESLLCADGDHQPRRVSAEVVVLAAGAVENARLLLLSTAPTFPRGLANGSGRVGRYFMSHPTLDVLGRLAERVYPYRIGFSTAMSSQFAAPRDRREHGAFALEFLNNAGSSPAHIAVSSGVWGAELRAQVAREFGRWLGIRIYAEPLPEPTRLVALDQTVTDPFGDPVPHLVYSIEPYEQEALRRGREVAERILRAAGASEIRVGRPWPSGHQIGTHRMGREPMTSVVDPNLRAHGVPNLYVVGSGCFVTASASPPTLTIVALAIRAAEHIARQLAAGPTRAMVPAAAGEDTA